MAGKRPTRNLSINTAGYNQPQKPVDTRKTLSQKWGAPSSNVKDYRAEPTTVSDLLSRRFEEIGNMVNGGFQETNMDIANTYNSMRGYKESPETLSSRLSAMTPDVKTSKGKKK